MSLDIFLSNSFQNCGNELVLAGLFEHIPNVYLFVKNAESQFLHVNRNFAKLLGANHLQDVVGKTDHDFFPRHLADEYRKEDIGVLQGTLNVVEKIWLVPRSNRRLDWFFSTKLPVRGRANPCQPESIGLVGYIRDCRESDLGSEQDFAIKKLADFILTNYSQHIPAKELAELAGLSVSQMNRRFHQAYQMSPQQFLLTVRLKIASQLLVITEDPITSIVWDTGFFDQSHFSRHFRRFYGMSPNQYRIYYHEMAHQ